MDIPTIFTQPENFYSLACYTYILSGVICAVVRWFHMCRPFDQRGDYFYPARRQVTFFYAATALQLPYMLCPGDPGSWFFARSFGILYYPVCFALLYHRFFQMRHLWSKKLYCLFLLTISVAWRPFRHRRFSSERPASPIQEIMGMYYGMREHTAYLPTGQGV